MVERNEIVREARRVAQAVADEAEAGARQLQHEAEDYVDQKLASFEIVLERTMQAVQKGEEYDLFSPRTGAAVGKLDARKVWDLIVQNAWRSGTGQAR